MAEQNKPRAQADDEIDKLYHNMRSTYAQDDSRANGYRLQEYFFRERRQLVAEVRDEDRVILDLACGSGLMCTTLDWENRRIVGIDYNANACAAARANDIDIIRGDAFSLPLAKASVDCVINCQFLNQQTEEQAHILLDEVHRVLKPGGRLLLVWRNDRAWIHKLALFVYRYIDRLAGRPGFPHYDNYIDDLSDYAERGGYLVKKKMLSFPLFCWEFYNCKNIAARAMGASCFLVLEKS